MIVLFYRGLVRETFKLFDVVIVYFISDVFYTSDIILYIIISVIYHKYYKQYNITYII